jgi:hypothetical protein
MFDRVNYRPVSALAVANMNGGFPNDHVNEKSRDSGENGPRPPLLTLENQGQRWWKAPGTKKCTTPNRLRLACYKSGAGICFAVAVLTNTVRSEKLIP